jgi:serine/threonine protein phosphatase PrpC
MDEIDMTKSDPERTFSDAPVIEPEFADRVATVGDGPRTRWESSQSFRVGYATHVGCLRNRNEDSVLVMTLSLVGEVSDLTFGLFVVADGMGGHSEGQKASQVASRVVAREVMGRLYGPFLQLERSETPGPVLATLTDSVQMANMRINRANPQSGTTLTAGLVVGNRLYLAHVGDSRAYLAGDDETGVELLTLDHTLVQHLQDSGQITSQEALVHPQRNILYRAVGQGEKLEIDSLSRVIPRPGWLLLCSDGLWGLVDGETIGRILRESQNPQVACDTLVSLALDSGAPDNVSVVAIQFGTVATATSANPGARDARSF